MTANEKNRELLIRCTMPYLFFTSLSYLLTQLLLLPTNSRPVHGDDLLHHVCKNGLLNHNFLDLEHGNIGNILYVVLLVQHYSKQFNLQFKKIHTLTHLMKEIQPIKPLPFISMVLFWNVWRKESKCTLTNLAIKLRH